jgi:hypothetical protein
MHRGARGAGTSVQPVSRDARVLTLGNAKRLALSAATAFLAVNLWTGAPLLSLWIGSQAVGKKQLSFQAVAVVVIVLGVLVLAMAFGLAKLNAAYDRLIGRPTRERRLTWLRSMRDEDWRDEVDRLEGITMLERIVMVNVWVAEIVFLIWFFAFAGSPLPH